MKVARTFLKITRPLATAWVVFLLMGAVVVLDSCNSDPLSPGVEYMPDMYRTPALEPYSGNSFYGDSMEARLPVEGTVARGYEIYAYTNDSNGYEMAGAELKNPIELTDEIKEEGKVLYAKYCMHCHGETGNGDGMVVTNGGFPPPPSYSTGNSARGGAMKDLTAGKIYHTIMYGLNTMGSHASQLIPEERWKIVHYVQTLQGDKEEDKADEADAEGAEDTTDAETDGEAEE